MMFTQWVVSLFVGDDDQIYVRGPEISGLSHDDASNVYNASVSCQA